MSSSVVKVNADVIANAEEACEVTAEQAQEHAIAAGLKDFNVGQYGSKKVVGKYLVTGVGGHILVDAHLTRAQIKRVADIAEDIIKNREVDAELRIKAIGNFAKLLTAGAAYAVVELKSAEIAGVGLKRDRNKSIAPQVNCETAIIHQDNRQVNVEKPSQE